MSASSSRSLPRFLAWIGVGLLAAGAWAASYYQAFTDIMPFDDEGGLIASLRDFVQGKSLYGDVKSLYGPAYFFYEGVLHGITGSLPTNDSVRLVSILFRVLCAVMALGYVRKVTDSWAFGMVAFLCAYRVGDFLTQEPSHPQELCLFLILATLAASAAEWRFSWRLAVLGFIAGVAVMTKINVGLMMVLVLAIVLVQATPRTLLWRLARVAVVPAAMGLVLVLVWPNLGMGWAQRFLFLEECSLAALLVTLWDSELDVKVGWASLLPLGAGALAAIGALAVYALAHGSTVGGMFYWLVVAPRKFIGPNWYLPLATKTSVLTVALAGPFVALAVRWGKVPGWLVCLMQVGVGAGAIVLALMGRWAILLSGVTPFVWLAAVGDRSLGEGGDGRRENVGRPGGLRYNSVRTFLAAVGVLFLLYAYPVAGAQRRLFAICLTVVGCVILRDGLAKLPLGRLWDAAEPLAVAAVVLVLSVSLVRAIRFYYEAVPLGLHGAERLRLDPDYAKQLRGVSQAAMGRCSVLVTAPGMPSFNLWTGVPPNPHMVPGNWVTGFDDAAQIEILKELDAAARPCFIYNEQMVNFWTHSADVSSRPLIRYMWANYHPVFEDGPYRLMVRNQRME